MDGPRILGLLGLAAALAVADEPARANGSAAELVVVAPWGDGDGALGRRGGDESNFEGPPSFAVGLAGDLFVLDAVNRRAARWSADGAWLGATPLGSETFVDLAVAPGGELVLLDRLVARVVRVVTLDGTVVGEAPVEGEGIPEGGGVTGVFARDDGVWLEYEHRWSVRVMDPRFAPAFYRWAVPGRPAGPDALHVGAGRRGIDALDVWTFDREAGQELARATLRFAKPVDRIGGLGRNAAGRLMLAAHLLVEGPGPGYEVEFSGFEVVVLDAGLQERARFAAPDSEGPWEQWDAFELADDGAVWQSAFTERGVEVRRWRP
ncbi:MAG: hypothetical protein JXB32_10130 [Deltaproteobacteria bacterium]|nr:hypothetical protein [Deltaproteobacteria bacterium]